MSDPAGARVEITAGLGAVMRFGELVVWVGPTASASLASYLARGATAAGASETSGRQLCDQVAEVLRAGDPEPVAPFVILGPAGQAWVALLHGPVQCWDGTRWSAPTPASPWLQLTVGQPATVIAGPAGSPVPQRPPDSPYNLERGVVPGGGFTLTPRPRPAGAGVAPAETVDLRDVPPPALPPLPGAGAVVADPGGPQVSGVRCAAGHLNRPAAPLCVTCHRPVATDATPANGPRPPLGVLIRDDGAVFGLTGDYVVGSDPASDPAVATGRARPLVLAGSDNVAPAHAELRVNGWDVSVADRGAPAGTFVLAPGDGQWYRLPPLGTHVLTPGTHLACGSRVLTYTSPWPA